MDRIQKTNQDYYDREAELRAAHMSNPFYFEDQFREFLKRLKARDTVLDIGCGHGPNIPLFLGMGRKLKYEGLDISEKSIQIAKSRYPQLKFHAANLLEKKNLPHKKYSGFWASAVLQHIPEKDWPKMLDNIESILKKNALGFFTIPEDRQNKSKDKSKKDPRHFTVMQESQVKEILADRDWRIIKTGRLSASRATKVWRWYLIRTN